MRWALLTLVFLLPGCMDDGEFFTGWVEGVTMDASHKAFTAQGCFAGASERCHEIRVAIDNSVNENDLKVGSTRWSAVGSDGGVYERLQVDGPDAIAAGAQGSVTLSIRVPSDVRVTEVRFGAFDDVLMKDAV